MSSRLRSFNVVTCSVFHESAHLPSLLLTVIRTGKTLSLPSFFLFVFGNFFDTGLLSTCENSLRGCETELYNKERQLSENEVEKHSLIQLSKKTSHKGNTNNRRISTSGGCCPVVHTTTRPLLQHQPMTRPAPHRDSNPRHHRLSDTPPEQIPHEYNSTNIEFPKTGTKPSWVHPKNPKNEASYTTNDCGCGNPDSNGFVIQSEAKLPAPSKSWALLPENYSSLAEPEFAKVTLTNAAQNGLGAERLKRKEEKEGIHGVEKEGRGVCNKTLAISTAWEYCKTRSFTTPAPALSTLTKWVE